jgi:hypothetical protein
MASNLALKEEMTEGLGSFALGEADAEAYFAEEVDSGGIADLGAIRERMARAGRFDDDHVGHLATGELVVPAPLLEKLPELRESILGHLREMGVEDPERYIVGNKLNSVNPETGMVEFGFFSSIGKAFKSVGKFLKKAAPTIIKIAGTVILTPFVGPIAAGMIANGIGTLAGGGSIKQAIMSSAIGGVTGYLGGPDGMLGDIGAQALGGAAETALVGGDMSLGGIARGAAMGAAGAIAGKAARANLGGTELGGRLRMTDLGGTTTMDLIKADVGYGGDYSATGINTATVNDQLFPKTPAQVNQAAQVSNAAQPAAVPPAGAAKNLTALSVDDFDSMAGGTSSLPPAPQNMLQRTLGDNMLTRTVSDTGLGRALQDPVQAFTGAEKITGIDILNSAPHVPADVQAKFAASAKAQGPGGWSTSQQSIANLLADSSSPSFIGRNPLLATVVGAGGIGALAYGMDDEQPKTESPGIVPQRASEADIAANRLAAISGNPDALKPLTFPNRQTLVNAPVNEDLRRRFPDIFAAADGGGVFPRRTGGIMPNEGIPGQDSVRAMVMPGEFIFTTDAVRGASPDGSLNGGINNMYSVMRNLETRGRRMA